MLKPTLLAFALTATLVSGAAAQEQDRPAYLVASLEVSDLNAYFEKYGGPVFPMLASAGAEVLVGSPSVNVLEGEYGSTWTAVVKFPTMEALDTWYSSSEYQAIAPERRALSNDGTSVLFAAPAFVMPGQ